MSREDEFRDFGPSEPPLGWTTKIKRLATRIKQVKNSGDRTVVGYLDEDVSFNIQQVLQAVEDEELAEEQGTTYIDQLKELRRELKGDRRQQN